MRKLLDALARHHHAHADAETQLDRSLTARELQERTGIRDVYEYVRRLNRAVSEAALEQHGRPCLVVQRIEGGTGRDNDHYVLVADRTLLD